MLARHLRRARTGGTGASCVHRRCYSSEQWSRLESKAMAIVQGLEQQGQTVGVAELASGGLISAGDCRRSNLSPPATSPDPGPTLAPTVFLASSVDVAFRTPVLQGRRRAAGLRHQSRRRPAGPRARAQLRRGEDEFWRRRHVKQREPAWPARAASAAECQRPAEAPGGLRLPVRQPVRRRSGRMGRGLKTSSGIGATWEAQPVCGRVSRAEDSQLPACF